MAAPDGGGAGTRGGLPRAQSVLLGSVFAAVLLVAIVGAWVILRGRSRSNRGAAAESNESALAQLSAARASAPPARTGSAREPERTPQQRAAADFLASNYRVQFMRHMPGRAPVRLDPHCLASSELLPHLGTLPEQAHSTRLKCRGMHPGSPIMQNHATFLALLA